MNNSVELEKNASVKHTKAIAKAVAKEVAAQKQQEKSVEGVKAMEVKNEETKSAEVKKSEDNKAAVTKKPAAKNAPAKKATTKKTQTSKAEEKKEPKAMKKITEEVFVQYANQEILTSDLVERVKAAYIAEGHSADTIKKVRVYIKPEENMIYYVVNEDYASGISLF